MIPEMEAVFWQDAWADADDKPTIDDVGLSISFGKIVKEDDRFVFVSHMFCGIEGGWRGPYTIIPKSLVVKRIRLIGDYSRQ